MQDRDTLPIYRKIAEHYRDQIVNEELRPGASLPSQTDLAVMHQTSVITIRKALSLLVNEGLICRIRKRGTFVTERRMDVNRLYTHADIRTMYFVYSNVSISVLSQDIHTNMLNAIQNVCYENGVDFVFYNVGADMKLPNSPNAVYIIFGLGGRMMSAVEAWKQEARRMIVVYNFFPHLEVPHVNGDNFTGGYIATQYLLSQGHKRIGIIVTGRSPNDLMAEFALRLQGYQTALRNFNIPVDTDLICAVGGETEAWEPETSGYQGFERLMSLPHKPTAIFAASDFKALGVMHAARDMDIRIPEDISLIGYDGHGFGQFTNPGLTTIDQDTRALGEQVARQILGLSNGPNDALVQPHLVVRGSTQAL